MHVPAFLLSFLRFRSEESEAETSWYRQNEITIVMSLISIVVPNFFDLIGLLEQYHPRKAMRWILARIMALNLLRSVQTITFPIHTRNKKYILVQNTWLQFLSEMPILLS